VGVCDAASREIPLWVSNIINDPKGGFLKAFFSFFHHYFIKPNNALFTRLRGKRAWVSPARFSKLYTRLIKDLQQNTNARIICLGINLANERVEQIIPGSAKNYRDYSAIIQSCAKQAGVPYINTHDLTASDHFPDGTHFNDAGHQIITARILDVILHENR
jgi:lysophospholipase L1-like esterase